MEILVEQNGDYTNIDAQFDALMAQGFKTAMMLYAEGGFVQDPNYKNVIDTRLKNRFENGLQIFGGIFPGIMDNGELMSRGSIIAGIQSKVHIAALEQLDPQSMRQDLETQLAPVKPALENGEFNTLFVFGDGFGENNHHLIDGLNELVAAYPMNVIGGLTGRDQVKAAHFTIFTPEKMIQNGAVLAFTRLESGIGVRHGWEPLLESELEVTAINGCFIEAFNNKPALDVYLDLICSYDQEIQQIRDSVVRDVDLFFDRVAIRYPLGLIRKAKNRKTYIDRTAVSLGGDNSLQFSTEIPVGTEVSILHLKGESKTDQCNQLTNAAISAYRESQRKFPEGTLGKRVIMMDCVGRNKLVTDLGRNFEEVEFKNISQVQRNTDHSPIGPLTFGEISSTGDGGVELHNKTAVVATIEDH
ncbi:MAG: FIST C-terminal domain-containing protein [Desulfobacterales bacterium]|nr:FIST C-terminal domain-containing protein [Desulfobacterales bacterium]